MTTPPTGTGKPGPRELGGTSNRSAAPSPPPHWDWGSPCPRPEIAGDLLLRGEEMARPAGRKLDPVAVQAQEQRQEGVRIGRQAGHPGEAVSCRYIQVHWAMLAARIRLLRTGWGPCGRRARSATASASEAPGSVEDHRCGHRRGIAAMSIHSKISNRFWMAMAPARCSLYRPASAARSSRRSPVPC